MLAMVELASTGRRSCPLEMIGFRAKGYDPRAMNAYTFLRRSPLLMASICNSTSATNTRRLKTARNFVPRKSHHVELLGTIGDVGSEKLRGCWLRV